jgi:phage tail protein X
VVDQPNITETIHVATGDTLASISSRFYDGRVGGALELLKANPTLGKDVNAALTPGISLTIPANTSTRSAFGGTVDPMGTSRFVRREAAGLEARKLLQQAVGRLDCSFA